MTFSQAVEFERFLEYGKGRSFHHSLTAFEEECRPLVLLVLELVGAYRESYAQFKRGALETEPVLKELVLGKSARERFFGILEGRSLECEDPRRQKRDLTVKKENPKICFRVEKTGKDGVKLTVPEEIMAFSGEKHLLVADWGSVCICDQEYTDALTVLMEYTVMGQDAEREILINDRDMPCFMSAS